MNELERIALITKAQEIAKKSNERIDVVIDRLLGIKRSVVVKLGQDEPIVKRDPDMKI